MGQMRQALDSEYISVRRPMRGRRLYTNVDSADPFRFLLGGECSPFSPYHWICTGELLVRTRHGQCRPKKSQRNRNKFVERHVWARCRKDGAQLRRLRVYLFGSAYGHITRSNTPHDPGEKRQLALAGSR